MATALLLAAGLTACQEGDATPPADQALERAQHFGALVCIRQPAEVSLHIVLHVSQA